MLLNLLIRHFGIIEQLEIQFNNGLNVLTGETGAGKSIILDALQVVLGSRASAEYIRAGSERSLVQGTFDPGLAANIEELLANAGVVPEDDGMLILARELNKSGRNVCRVNGQVVPLSQYRLIGQALVDLQSQHEQYSLQNPDRQMDLLDLFGGEEVTDTAGKVSSIYRIWHEADKCLQELRSGAADMSRRADLLKYQLDEIDKAGLQPGECDELSKERAILSNAEKIKRLVNECHNWLYSGGIGVIPVVDLLGRACRSLEELSRLDPEMDIHKNNLYNSRYLIEDTARELAGYLDSVDFNPFRLEAVEARLARIDALLKKYGGNIEDILNRREEIETELNGLIGSEEKIDVLQRQLHTHREEWTGLAKKLKALRKKTSFRLQGEVARQLADLEMGRVNFQVVFAEQEEINGKGMERVEFNISPNPGEPLRPLGKIASGGELSRIMLAVKTILAEMDNIPTLVFDEVESGIGGRALHAVAEKLAGLSQKRQVICVTHAAVVAALAETHYHIYKEESSGRTITRVKRLSEEERTIELARMLGGRDSTGAAMEHARQLLRGVE